MAKRIEGLALLASLLLAACGGNYSGAPAQNGNGSSGGSSGGGSSGGGSSTGFSDARAFFDARVEPNLGFCRTCHIPGGVADTPGTSPATQGNLFMLSQDSGQDYDKVMAAWTALGKGVANNKLLTNPSDPAQSHTGGQPWPSGSQPYAAMQTVLSCWDNPSGCAALIGGSSSGGPVTQQAPLLGTRHSGHVWSDYCAGKADDAVLPVDPRTLVVPGVNQDKAVVFNAYWKTCANPTAKPANCGEYRAMVAKGELIGEGQGQPGTATMFSASKSNADFSIPASDYNNLWQVWGLPGRPQQFDQLVAERHGSALAPQRNPYPLPGEDPNTSNGGSGQLPLVYTQLRNADGSWTGKIGVKFCAFCHNGQVGTAADGPGLGPQVGGAGSIGDFEVAFRDFAFTGALSFGATSGILNIASNRGTGAIDQFQLGFILFANGNPALLPFPELVHSAAIGTIKSPPWWNMANRPQKFHGAILPMDASRIDMAAYYPIYDGLQGKGDEAVAWTDSADVPFQIWAESLKSPKYPGPIDTALAEQGAILFHSKDLWAPALNNPVPKPAGGNGSCAGCHGAYSPRYVNDPAYLDTPALEGIAARVEPLSVIGTDPVYAGAMQSLKRPDGSVNPVIYQNAFLYCGLGQTVDSTTPKMLAPPLYGIWAAAPYFHNGSVPNIWGVLKPSEERPPMWKRVSTPQPTGLNVVMGYDSNLQRAYDFDKLGWKYDAISCGQAGTIPLIDCNPLDPNAPPPLADLTSALYQNFWFLWNLPVQTLPPFSDAQIEKRKVYNTHLYSQGNGGHAFTSVLTDAERKAIIEYLKTL